MPRRAIFLFSMLFAVSALGELRPSVSAPRSVGQYLLGRADPDAQRRFTFVSQGRTAGRWIAALSPSSHVWGFVRMQAGGGGHATTTAEFNSTLEVSR